DDSQRRGRRWVVLGWMIPVANFFLPYQVVSDIYRASARRPVRVTLVGFWWAAMLINEGLLVFGRLFGNGATPVGEGRSDASAVAGSASAALGCNRVAAVLIRTIIVRVTAWQNDPGPALPLGP